MAGLEQLSGRTAVVTGGGSGIGRGMCRAFAVEGMKVVVADVDEASAKQVAEELRGSGADAIAVGCDVTQRSAVESLADQTRDAFSRIDVVCNNAGVLVGGRFLDLTPGNWEWVLSVNVMGVVHGSTVFGSILAEQGAGHIVNTASIGGFLSGGDLAPYTASKFAVVALSDSLRNELAPIGVGVSTLCPGPIDTSLPSVDRLRPDSAGAAGGSSQAVAPMIAGGMNPDDVGPIVVRGIREGRHYIFTHPEMLAEGLQARHDAVMAWTRQG
jgi:NAD(P)-dependent dehydrogenase (short-subunit alcohol dehydrogenase family)